MIVIIHPVHTHPRYIQKNYMHYKSYIFIPDDDQDINDGDDEGFGKSPTTPNYAKQTKSAASKRFNYSRSCSAPFGIAIRHHGESNKELVRKKLPQVTISDFSALNLEAPDSASRHSVR